MVRKGFRAVAAAIRSAVAVELAYFFQILCPKTCIKSVIKGSSFEVRFRIIVVRVGSLKVH